MATERGYVYGNKVRVSETGERGKVVRVSAGGKIGVEHVNGEWAFYDADELEHVEAAEPVPPVPSSAGEITDLVMPAGEVMRLHERIDALEAALNGILYRCANIDSSMWEETVAEVERTAANALAAASAQP